MSLDAFGDRGDFVCRYDALGPPSGCKGQCEGTGFVPHAEYLRPALPGEVRPSGGRPDDEPPIFRVMWFLLEARRSSNAWPSSENDAYHFVPCPDCRPDDPVVRLARALMGGA